MSLLSPERAPRSALVGSTQPSSQTLARVTGALFLLTFVTAIAGDVLYNPALDDRGYIVGTGADTRVTLGALCELVLIIANIGTALALFPILKRQNEGLALGYVAARIVECVFIGVGLLSMLALVALRQEPAGAADASLIPIGQTLVGIKDWTFLLGPGFVVGVGNGLILGYLMYRSRLVPRGMAMLGLIGGPLICASGIAVMFGGIDQGSDWQMLATVPEFFWELSLGVYLLVMGFKPSSPLLAAGERDPLT